MQKLFNFIKVLFSLPGQNYAFHAQCLITFAINVSQVKGSQADSTQNRCTAQVCDSWQGCLRHKLPFLHEVECILMCSQQRRYRIMSIYRT